MDYAALVHATDREAGAFEDALRAGPLDVVVPSCPDWTMLDLGLHVGEFMGWWTHVLCEGTGSHKPDLGDPPGPDGVGEWVHRAHSELVEVLSETSPDQEVWTWADDSTAA